MQAWLGGKSCFSHTNASNFRRQLQSLLWDIRLKILRLPKFNMLFQLVLTKVFKSELLLRLPIVGRVIKSCKEPIETLVGLKISNRAWKFSGTQGIKQLMYVLKLFQDSPSARIRSTETLRIMYPGYPVFDRIQRIHLRCGSFGSIICFWILAKEQNIRFQIIIGNFDFSKETYPKFVPLESKKLTKTYIQQGIPTGFITLALWLSEW